MTHKMGICYDDIFMQHDTGPGNIYFRLENLLEPETFIESRLRACQMKKIMQASGIMAELIAIPFGSASLEQLGYVHRLEYIRYIRETCQQGGGDAGNGTTPMDSTSFEVASRGAGAALAAVDAVMDGDVSSVYCLVRPPGHHALPDFGMGFCIFNNGALAATHALKQHALCRVMIIDWDSHHGNGTQAIFWKSPQVLTVSLHQDGMYPQDSGRIEEAGEGDGLGYNVNIPLPAGTGNEGYRYAFERVIEPLADWYRPELVIAASGQDASIFDPLARLSLTMAGFRMLGEKTAQIARRYANGRLVLTQEGGYNTTYGPFCCAATIEAVAGLEHQLADPFEMDQVPAQRLTREQIEVVETVALVARRNLGLASL